MFGMPDFWLDNQFSENHQNDNLNLSHQTPTMQNFFKFLGHILDVYFMLSCSSAPMYLKDLTGEYAGYRELSSDRLIIRFDSI